MKKLLFILVVLTVVGCDAQKANEHPLETVDWDNAKIFTVDEFTFDSDLVKYSCMNCKVMEVKTPLLLQV